MRHTVRVPDLWILGASPEWSEEKHIQKIQSENSSWVDHDWLLTHSVLSFWLNVVFGWPQVITKLVMRPQIKQSLVEITALPIYDVRLIKDKLTGTSRGFCFVELESVQVRLQDVSIQYTTSLFICITDILNTLFWNGGLSPKFWLG